tara:strand:- start:5358 stop:6563 length:1206 start_codon:yes stop_codon:yes gene_type:complete
MANRVYFANQQVAIKPAASTTWQYAHGVQSVAVTTTFNLEQAFELGQLAIYENIEGVPDIEVSASKVLDGYALLYCLATNQAAGHNTSPTLAGRSNASSVVALGIWPDTQDSASGNPSQQMEASGMFCSSVSYNFPLEDNFSEDITLVGNNKGWADMSSEGDAISCTNPGWEFDFAAGQFAANADGPKATGTNDLGGGVSYDQQGGVNRRENLAFAESSAVLQHATSGVDYTRLPTEIPGIDSAGWMSPKQNASNDVRLQSLTVSTDLGREELFELGTRQPYARVVTFPIEVTCDIEVLSLSGDMINAFADGCVGTTDPCTGISDNLSDQTIRIATCEGTRIFIGDKNKLASVNYGGGDAGGGNVTVTYSYTTFNDFTVLHPQDPNPSGTGWWDDRATYLK